MFNQHIILSHIEWSPNCIVPDFVILVNIVIHVYRVVMKLAIHTPGELVEYK